ncbi:SDR family NAD(P)-dependent oxidoreductase [Actinophytocola algeriensis]|uniref:SDR family NAD(P)-dependent oxidoreductase n=1 Tax=Actinophytocola algeriensis TaxID=1768010 RepID=UPI0016086DAB|nr:SDR family NAD(P)-dependent oxidoreductase [Actinophytocola algeriensis]
MRCEVAISLSVPRRSNAIHVSTWTRRRATGQLDAKVALVTGGTEGIGLATARRLASERATVYVTGRRQDKVAAAVVEIADDVTGFTGDGRPRQPRPPLSP